LYDTGIPGAHVGFRALNDFVEGLRSVADLEHRHAHARQLDEIALRFFEYGNGQNCGTGGKIVDAHFRFQTCV
jgi:hypothetical protein